MFRRTFAAALCAGLALGGFTASPDLLRAARPEHGFDNSSTRRRVRQFSSANRTSYLSISRKGPRPAPKKKTALTKCAKRARAKAKYRNRK